MADRVRILNEEGIAAFRDYVEGARGGTAEPAPVHLLTDQASSEPFEPAVFVARGEAKTRLEFGRRLVNWLADADARAIARHVGLWNWLSLYFLDELAPPEAGGRRRLLAVPHYVLEADFVWTRAYRHLVRFAWMACRQHPDHAAILLLSGKDDGRRIGHWGEFSEQLGASQWIFGSRAAIAGARRMFFDDKGAMRRGAASQGGPGSVRRLATLCNQLWLTYDIEAMGPDALVALLPREFDRWRSPRLSAPPQAAAQQDDRSGPPP